MQGKLGRGGGGSEGVAARPLTKSVAVDRDKRYVLTIALLLFLQSSVCVYASKLNSTTM